MGIVEEQLRRIDALSETIEDEAKKIVIANMDAIISILEKKQLGIGLNSSGGPLSWAYGDGTYAKRTEEIAKTEFTVEPKKEGEPYNFQWTGGTFNGLNLKTLSKNKYSIFSTDGKAAFLRKTYGIIFDLTKENNDLVNDTIIEPGLVIYIEDNWWR